MADRRSIRPGSHIDVPACAARADRSPAMISENVSLDGVVQDPTGEEGFKHGGWFEQFMGEDREAWAKVEFAEALGAEALLLGWAKRRVLRVAVGIPERRLGGQVERPPKYVVSTTLVVDTRTVGDGLAYLIYERVRDA